MMGGPPSRHTVSFMPSMATFTFIAVLALGAATRATAEGTAWLIAGQYMDFHPLHYMRCSERFILSENWLPGFCSSS